MTKLLAAAITFFAYSYTAWASICSSYIGTCDYYSCIEQEVITCGDSGYALGYGGKYCQRFTEMTFAPHRTAIEEAAYPANGAAWRDRVKSCLMQELEQYLDSGKEVSCSELRAYAFKSHPDCYTRSPSFCELTLENVARVGLTIDARTILTKESIEQVRDTATICVRDLTVRIKDAPSFAVRWQLQHARGIWRLIAKKPEMIRELQSLK